MIQNLLDFYLLVGLHGLNVTYYSIYFKFYVIMYIYAYFIYTCTHTYIYICISFFVHPMHPKTCPYSMCAPVQMITQVDLIL